MYLGVDLGTSGVKALLIDEDQRVVASAVDGLTVSRPHPGWSEQDPACWIRATENVLDTIARDHSQALSAVRGIGLSGQQHGAVLLGADDRVLRPAILWNDIRSVKEAAELDGNPAVRSILQNIVFPGYTAPKILWTRTHEPSTTAALAKVLLPKDYLRLWLTGEAVSDMSDASGTGWLDIARRAWSDELLETAALTREHMPRLVEGTEISGHLRAELASRWGLGHGVPVVGGAGDNAASACGLGVVDERHSFLSLGTSGVLFAANDAFRPNAESTIHTFCHAVPETWHQMGVILSATDALNWYADVLDASPSSLTEELGSSLASPSSAVFLPYLSGERTPHNDPNVRGALMGLERLHDRRQVTQAVLQGVAFAIRDNVEILRSMGSNFDHPMVVGGGTQSPYWMTMIATCLGVPVHIPVGGHLGASFGAARMAMMASPNADPKEVFRLPSIEKSFDPVREKEAAYENAYQVFRQTYPLAALVSRFS